MLFIKEILLKILCFFLENKTKFILFSLFLFVLYFFSSNVIIDNESFKTFKRIIQSFCILTLMFVYTKRRYRFIFIPFILVWIVQFLSFVSTGEYINQLTLENIQEFRVIGRDLLLYNLFIFTSIIVFFVYLNTVNTYCYRKVFSVISVLLLSFILFCGGGNLFIHFYKTCYSFYLTNFVSDKYSDGSKFKKIFNSSFSSVNQKNVIVIFSEGLSDRVISKSLTPNLYSLKSKSLVFDNYFNHTAATFKGLRGQLISGYQKKAGYCNDNSGVGQLSKKHLRNTVNSKIESLPTILSEQGYKTVFVGPHLCDNNLYSLMSIVGFEQTKGVCDYSKNSYKSSSYLTDQESFDLLKNTIQNFRNNNQRYFISFYNIQTHHGMVVKDHIYGDGSNDYLNKFHNYDYYLGDFISWCEKNRIIDDSLLIVTADHSTYAVKQFEHTFNFTSDTNTRFVDRIPLIIYSSDIKAEHRDAYGRNSLCFSPTVLDLLGLKNINSHFLGNSLFQEQISRWETYSILNNIFIDTSNGKAHDLNAIGEVLESELVDYYSFESF